MQMLMYFDLLKLFDCVNVIKKPLKEFYRWYTNLSCCSPISICQKFNSCRYAVLLRKLLNVAWGHWLFIVTDKKIKLKNLYLVNFSAPGSGEGTSTGDMPHPPRKKRARVDPTVESVCQFKVCLKQIGQC